MFELQALLGEFLAQIGVSSEGSPTANQLQRRVSVVLERADLTETQLPETLRFAGEQIATVEQAMNAFREVSAVLAETTLPGTNRINGRALALSTALSPSRGTRAAPPC